MRISRRQFTTVTAVGLASIMVPGLSSCDVLDLPFLKSDDDFDVVVVGAGGAGLCAAVAAYDAGARVLVLEKAKQAGGNTEFIESGMNAAGTSVQKTAGIEDTPEAFAEDTLKGGHYAADEALVQFMCSSSADAFSWLNQLGVTLDEVSEIAGMHIARTHRPSDHTSLGSHLVPALLQAIEERKIPLKCGVEVKSLQVDNQGACTGVVVADDRGQETGYTARAVVLATGGMCANLDMVSEYRPDLAGCTSTNLASTTGEGYMMAQQAGAQLIHMDEIQVHPTVAKPHGSGHAGFNTQEDQNQDEGPQAVLIPDSLRRSGALLVNADAQRFYDETAAHTYLTRALLDQPGQYAWLIFDDEVRDAHPIVAATYEPRGIVAQGATVAELTQQVTLVGENLARQLDEYNASVRDDALDPFGRTIGRRALEGTLYAIKVMVGAHYQMGGVRIDVQSRALNDAGDPVPGLFAAGEVTGGVHGQNRLGGNGACDVVVFGRNAGLEAAAYAAEASPSTTETAASATSGSEATTSESPTKG